jgi:type II secretory pathway pseudopilin PulG
MKTIIQVVLWIACIGFGYLIYQSVTGPIQFKKVKTERFGKVIAKLKDIRNSQEAYKTANGRYANDFKTLISFVDTGNYTITQQRDSSYMAFDKTYNIDLLQQIKIIDTLGFVSVKDSLFKKDDRYKSLMDVPGGVGGEKFEMKSTTIQKGDYTAAVFEAKVKKDVVLHDQPQDLRDRENAHISVEEVNGNEIKVGSLEQVSTSGNWPPIYDRKEDK